MKAERPVLLISFQLKVNLEPSRPGN